MNIEEGPKIGRVRKKTVSGKMYEKGDGPRQKGGKKRIIGESVEFITKETLQLRGIVAESDTVQGGTKWELFNVQAY